uniref:Uncharacterized protein n=1 Tax=Arundo donax TaxID=35708 RepID=A0A0A8ZY21_ARUDO
MDKILGLSNQTAISILNTSSTPPGMIVMAGRKTRS